MSSKVRLSGDLLLVCVVVDAGVGNANRQVSATMALRPTTYASRPANLASMSIHRGLAIFYGLIALFTVAFAEPYEVAALASFVLLICAIHGAIAFGASRRAGWARIMSMIVAILMILAVPVGTIIGIYLLRNLDWRLAADV